MVLETRPHLAAFKWNFARTIALGADFVFLLDTHSADFKTWEVQLRCTRMGFTPVFSHLSTHRAGVAVFIRNTLMDKY